MKRLEWVEQRNIDLSVLKGKKLINIDSEEEGVLTVGCAGGFGYNTEIPVTREAEGEKISIRIHGLLGGHSGQRFTNSVEMDIK